jgi:hypothetical protein
MQNSPAQHQFDTQPTARRSERSEESTYFTFASACFFIPHWITALTHQETNSPQKTE